MKNQYFSIHLLFLLLLSTNGVVAQKPAYHSLENTKTLIANLPPTQVRTMAEWEEVEALVIAWESDEDILTEIVRYAVQECKVYIFTDNENGVRSQLLSAGIIQPDSILYIPYPTDRVWMRDYGPWSVYHNDVETLAFSDFLYNRFDRHNDDFAPHNLASYLDIPLYNADENPFQWVHTGGNFLRDGMGTAYSSDLILRENSGKTGLEIENFASRFFGIHDYRFLHRLPYDTIHHLDMHIRTLDEETLGVGWYPEGVADGPQIEANLNYIRQHFRTPFGNPYHIIRLEMPPRFGNYPPVGHYRTYTNGIFINKTFLVPFYGENFDPIAQASDSAALQLYQAYLPGYKIEGINCNSIIPKLGALHCITKLVGVKNPLRITHPRLRDTYYTQQDYPVDAWVQHSSGVDSVFLHYRLSGDLFYDSLAMIDDTDDENHWQASIPAQEVGTEIQYYISAYANSGKKQVRPLPAPEAYYPFKIKAYEQLPKAAWLQSLSIAAPDMNIQFTADTQHGVTELMWSFPGGEPATSMDKDVFVQYSSPGVYPVQLIAHNPLGSDTLLLENAITVKEVFPPFMNDFEENWPEHWEATGEIEWQLWQNDDCHQNGLRISHQLSADDLNRSYLRTALDLRAIASAGLTFDIAHALRDSIYFDELRINLTDQYGKTHNIYNKGGHILATIDELMPNFIPGNCNHWRNETVDLREWEDQQVLLEFETIGDQGNNIYLDNIAIRANALPNVNITQPLDNTIYIGDGQLILDTIQVSASDPDGTIEKVTFYVNNQFLNEDFEAPYEYVYQIPIHEQYCYQVKAEDNEGLQVWAEQVCVRYDQETANETLAEDRFNWRISPNPVKERLNLDINSSINIPDALVSISDVQGKIIYRQEISFFAGAFQYSIPIKGIPKGSYFLQIQVDHFNKSLSFIKQ